MENIDLYSLYRYFHLVFMTTWMAGLFYLPRLFVYHSKAKLESREYETFIIMEKKLLRFIMNPSMIFTWIFGLLLVVHQEIYNEIWFKIKFIFVILISIFHMYCARVRKMFELKRNISKENFFRWINEIPTILFLVIIYLVIFKPFN